jgi:hypothetical protein
VWNTDRPLWMRLVAMYHPAAMRAMLDAEEEARRARES